MSSDFVCLIAIDISVYVDNQINDIPLYSVEGQTSYELSLFDSSHRFSGFK